MPSSESLLLSLLERLPNYKFRHIVKRHVMAVLGHYRALTPELVERRLSDGRQLLQLSLQGTIAVPYKGRTYNIPISVTVPRSYPVQAPRVCVKPTENMQIKAGKYVDPDGKVKLPYLTEWSSLLQCNLDTLIQKCAAIFSRKPPVFEKPKLRHLPAQRVMEVDGIQVCQAWVGVLILILGNWKTNTSCFQTQIANSLFRVLH